MKNDNKRKISFWSTDRPLVSPRVKKILSNPITSKILVQKIRNSRKNGT